MRPTRTAALFALGLLAACAGMEEPPVLPPAGVAIVPAFAETAAVDSTDDAADDPAIWVNEADPAASLVLGTDKQAGLNVYDLTGAPVQFLPSGLLNNVDLRKGVVLPGLEGDLAAATNRSDESVTFFAIAADGAVTEIGRLPVNTTEPYGFCMAYDGVAAHAFVTYKDGLVQRWVVTGFQNGGVTASQEEGWKLATQLEGCAADEEAGVIYIGEEGAGLWRAPLMGGAPVSIDTVGSATGLTADVEGVDIYEGADGAGYVVVSSQGSSTFHLYDRAFAPGQPNAFIGRFGVAHGPDMVTGTDGLDVLSAPLGDGLPAGLLVVQDDVNTAPAAPQNFKLIDWRDVLTALGLGPAS